MHPISVPAFTVPSTPIGAALAPSALSSSAEPLQQRSLSKDADAGSQPVPAAASVSAAVQPSLQQPHGPAPSLHHPVLHSHPGSGHADEAAATASSFPSASSAAGNGSLPASQSSGALHTVGSSQQPQAGPGASTAAASAPLPASGAHTKQPAQLSHPAQPAAPGSVPSTPRAAAAAALPSSASSAAAASASSSSLASSSALPLPAVPGTAAVAVHASPAPPPLGFGSLPLASPSSASSPSVPSYAALLDGLSESEESGDDGLGMRMIEEEDEDDDSVDEARSRSLGGSGAGSLADGSRRQQLSQRGFRRRGDEDEELHDGLSSSLSRPRAAYPPSALYPAAYQHGLLPPAAASSLLYSPLHPAAFVLQPAFAPFGPYQQQLHDPLLAASAAVSPHGAQPASSAPLLLSSPISLRGVRAFLFLCLVLNASSLLIRDASLASFGLFLLLGNAVLALCVLTGKPFALAVLVQTQPTLSAASRPAEQLQTPTDSGLAANAAQAPAPAAAAVRQSGGRQLGIGAAGSGVGGQPVSSPPPPAAVSPSAAASRLLPASPQASVPANDAAVGVSGAAAHSELPSLPPLPSAAADALLASAAALPASASSSAASSPPSSRSPSPSPPAAVAAAVSVGAAASPSSPSSPSPFSSPSPQFEYANWTVAPLPLFTRGFRHKVPAGCSTRYSEKPQLASWCRTAGESFMVRQGPGYRRTKAKSASAPSLYECVGVDIFQADSKIDHIARLLRLPLPPERLRRREPPLPDEKKRKAAATLAAAAAALQSQEGADGSAGSAVSAASLDPSVAALLSEYPDGEFEDGSDSLDGEYVPDADDAAVGVPPLWLVNFQIPAYAPPMPMWGKKEDGEGYSVVLYYRLTEQARDDLRHNTTPAARLLKSFTAGVGEERWHGRYKSIPRIVNPDECEVGRTVRSLITSYNAKPFLTGPWCHSFLKGPGYVECDIDVHRFRFVARKGAHAFLESLKSMVIDIAFVVEGQDDEELPEQIQGATRIHFPSPQDAQNITHYLRHYNKQ